MNNEVHKFVVKHQDHLQMIEIHAELQRLSGLMHDAGCVCLCTDLFWMMWKKKRYGICATIARN